MGGEGGGLLMGVKMSNSPSNLFYSFQTIHPLTPSKPPMHHSTNRPKTTHPPNPYAQISDLLNTHPGGHAKNDIIGNFRSLQNALYINCFVALLGGVFFLCTSFYVQRDRALTQKIINSMFWGWGWGFFWGLFKRCGWGFLGVV